MAFEAFYLPATQGQRFCLFHRPVVGADGARTDRGAVVYIHPFAEEMNKARRMAALQSRAMAAAGYAVLQIDLHGCGDSSGDFGDATWESWLEDVELACRWMQQQSDAPLWLWGLRTGCLLVSEAAQRNQQVYNLLFWQPVISGKQYLQQFLRLKVASDLAGGDNKAKMERLREQLQQGESVEIAGYLLSPGLAQRLMQSELTLPDSLSRLEWLDISSRSDVALSPAAAAKLESWQTAGRSLRATPISGPAFWQTAEIAECPALIEATLLAMADSNA